MPLGRATFRRGVTTLSLVLVLLTAGISRAERPPLKAYTTADGLPHDSVNRIVRDSRGFLWFCTADGLSRFDGYRFRNFSQEQGLPHRSINDLLETRSGTYLVATSAGLSILNPRGRPYRWNVHESRLEQTAAEPPLFRTFLPPPIPTRRSRTILSLAEDASGRIWAGTAAGLFQVERAGDDWTFRAVDLGQAIAEVPAVLADGSGGVFVGSSAGLHRIARDGTVEHLLAEGVSSIFQDREGRLWIDVGLRLKLYAFENDTLKLVHAFSERDGLPPRAIHFSAHQTANGRIYLGFEYGFAEVVPDAQGAPTVVRVFEREKINALAEDAGGALWIGTDTRGAWKLAPSGFTMFGEPDGLSPSDEIMSVIPDREGSIYLAARPNKLSHLVRGRFESVVPAGLNTRSWGWHFLDLLSKDGEWWIPASDGLRHYPRVATFADLARRPPVRVYTAADGLYSSEVFLQFEDSRGDIWFSVIGSIVNTVLRWERRTNRLVRYSIDDGLPSGNGPMSFAEDAHGNVWLGLYFGGLARYRRGAFRLFGEHDGLPYTQIADLLTDARGRLWIATSASGLLRVDDPDAETPAFQPISTADGLSSNQVICLTQDHDGRVYAGTGRGINRIDQDGHLKVFTVEDGLPSNQITRCAADASGALWFVARNTLLRFRPDVDRPAGPPSVLVDRMLVNGIGQHISELGEADPAPLDLGPDQHQIQVDYLALTSGAAENVRYQYRLDEQQWSAPTPQRSVDFDLSPGRRSLQIRAIDSSGLVSPHPVTLALRIQSPVWQRWWFLLSAACLTVGVLLALHRYRMARLREVNAALAGARRAEEALGQAREERLNELERVRARIATDLHDDIGSSLTQIAVLGEVAHRQADGTGNGALQPIERIISISNELVDSMSDIVWAINPRKDHLSDLLQRMRRFASDVLAARGITFRFQVPYAGHEVALGANVRREVFLIFKETIKNVVQHAACTHVEIAFELDGNDLVMTVRDDGRGFEPDAEDAPPAALPSRGGNGLPNMRRRARDMAGSLDVVSAPGAGTLTRLQISMARPTAERA